MASPANSKQNGGRKYGVVNPGIVRAIGAALSSPSSCLLTAASNSSKLEDYSKDRSFHPRAVPKVVVMPKTTEEVAKVVRICWENKIPITTRGAGTGLEGGCIPYEGAVVISTEKLKSVSVDSFNMYVDVGAGVLKNELNGVLNKQGFVFGPDPSSNPSVGGMVSTSGSGLSTLRYGTTRENVVSLLVVTPKGDIVKTRQKVRKASTGYELTQLYIGAEGTLGVITEICFRIFPQQKFRSGAVATFPSLELAAGAVVAMLKLDRSTIVRCELVNAEMILATNKNYKTSLEAKPTLFLEFRANDKDAIRREWDASRKVLDGFGVGDIKFSEEGDKIDEIWSARRGCYFSSMVARDEPKPDLVFVTDVCVPVKNLATCISQTESDFRRHGLPCLLCAHIADGNFHCLIPYKPHEKKQVQKLEHAMLERAVALGGAVSGEHGVGIGKREHMCHEHGKHHIGVQRAIKRALDPDLIMNPHKILDMNTDDVKSKL